MYVIVIYAVGHQVSNVVIPVSKNYQRITYGFDPPVRGNSYMDMLEIRFTTYGLRFMGYGLYPRHLAPYSQRESVLTISDDACSEKRCTSHSQPQL